MEQKYAQKFDERKIEKTVLSWLDELGWDTYGLKGGEGAHVLDDQFERNTTDLVYWKILKKKVKELNEKIDDSNIDSFISSLRSDLVYENLVEGNREFYKMLRRGKKFSITKDDGSNETIFVDLIDHEKLENNSLIAANQFRFRSGEIIRPDVNLFINGIPIVTMELKSITQENDYFDAIQDLEEYEDKAPKLFIPGLFNIAADSLEMRYAPVGGDSNSYSPWREAPEEYQSEVSLEQSIKALLNPQDLLEILDKFVFYQEDSGGKAKIVPRYMQYYASQRILNRLENTDYEKGLIWHAQGSGKSYTMLFTAKNLITTNVMENPQVLIIVDREKLEDQMGTTLGNIDFQQYEIAQDGDHLQEMLENGESKVILTTIQKFRDVDYDIQGNPETVVMSDEAHRFLEEDLGSYLDGALPDSYHFGFTGTPVRERNRDTFDNFYPEEDLENDQPYLHRYSMKQGIEDGLILKVVFTDKHEMAWDIDEEELDEEFETTFSDLSIDDRKEKIEKYVTRKEISELRPRVEEVASHIDEHFEGVEKNGWKGMVVTPSKKAAALYGDELLSLRDPEEIEVLITSSGDDDSIVQNFHTSKEERRGIVRRFKNEDNPKLLVVCDMLQTGFDAPVLKTMYLDRNLKNHSLLQAIARTNRPAEGKENGEIVDYQGVFQNIDDALEYDKEVQENAAMDKDVLFEGGKDVEGFKPLLKELIEIFEGIEKKGDPVTLNKCVSRLSKAPEKRKKFKQKYRKLQNLYETLSPDGRLAKPEIKERYKWLNQIYIAYNWETGDSSNPEEDLRKKTKEIIEENVLVDIKDEFNRYELDTEKMEEFETLEPSVKATKISHAVQNHLEPNVNKNPKYEKLSDRVKDVVERWQSGDITDPKAVEEFEEIEEETVEVMRGPEEMDMSESEYAIYCSLATDYSDKIKQEKTAEGIARSIGKGLKEEVDTDFPNWKENEDTLDDIRTMILDVIVKEYNKRDLYNTGLIENAIEYILENE